jgi:hypothetical protein
MAHGFASPQTDHLSVMQVFCVVLLVDDFQGEGLGALVIYQADNRLAGLRGHPRQRTQQRPLVAWRGRREQQPVEHPEANHDPAVVSEA